MVEIQGGMERLLYFSSCGAKYVNIEPDVE
jgi:hypothetical protein